MKVRMHKIKIVAFIPLFVSAVLNISCLGQNPSTARDESTTIIGIYSGEGAAQGCVIPAEKMFRWMGYQTKKIYAEDINDSRVSDIDIFYFPGGSSGPYLRDIDDRGKNVIRKSVENGCGYIGTCAGALFACQTQIWDGKVIQNGQLGLFKGTGYGPNPEIFAYPEIGMCRIDIDTTLSFTSSLDDSAWLMFYNGPYFEPDTLSGQNIFIIGFYSLNKRPAIIACEYGNGKVFLTGPHPEWEEDSDRDGIDFFKEFDDVGSDWELMKNAADWCLGN